MSIDELVRDEQATDPHRRKRHVMYALIASGCLLMLAAPLIARWMTSSQEDAAQARHDAVVSSTTPMPVLWEQLALPVEQRSQEIIEGAARLGTFGSDIVVSTQLRVSEPNRIGVVTTVTSDGITTLLLTLVRNLGGDTSDAFTNGCEAQGPSPLGDGLTCEQFIEQQLSTWTVRN